MNANSNLPSALGGRSVAVAVVGVTSLAVGVILLALAYQSSNAPLDQLSSALTGRFTDHTMWQMLFGSLVAVGGAALLLAGRWRS